MDVLEIQGMNLFCNTVSIGCEAVVVRFEMKDLLSLGRLAKYAHAIHVFRVSANEICVHKIFAFVFSVVKFCSVALCFSLRASVGQL